MATENTKTAPVQEEDEIDLVALVAKLWQGRKVILKITTFFAILGLAIALLTPNTYEAGSVFVTQSSAEKPSGSLGGLASLAGINLGGMGSEAGIPPALYPKILYAVPFKRAMLQVSVIYQEQKMTYAEYLRQKPLPLLAKFKKYTLGLPGQLIKWIKPSEEKKEASVQTTYGLRISDEEFKMLEDMEDRMNLNINDQEGYISLSVKDSDPEIAAQMAKWAEQHLQERVIAYKIQKTQEVFDFTQQQFVQKQQEVFNLQDQLASFTEQNQNINSAFVQNQLLRLESDYNMVNAVYTELAQQKEQAALQLKKDTPLFSIIDPVRIPNEKSEPKRSLMFIISVILGIVLSMGYVLAEEPIKELISSIKTSN